MTKLEELIYSLATVIVRYHSSQLNGNTTSDEASLRKKSRESAIKIMQHEEAKFTLKLNACIEACTIYYSERKKLLNYIVNEITFLKKQLDRREPFSTQEFERYQDQIIQFFFNLKQLLKISKNKLYTITYSALEKEPQTSVELQGLKLNSSLVSTTYSVLSGNPGNYCNSGKIITEEILNRFHLDPNPSLEDIKAMVVSLCLETQNALLVIDLQRQKLAWESSLTPANESIQERISAEPQGNLEKRQEEEKNEKKRIYTYPSLWSFGPQNLNSANSWAPFFQPPQKTLQNTENPIDPSLSTGSSCFLK